LARPEFAANPEKFYPVKTFAALGFSRACAQFARTTIGDIQRRKPPAVIPTVMDSIPSLETGSARRERKSLLLRLGKVLSRASPPLEFHAPLSTDTQSLPGGEMM